MKKALVVVLALVCAMGLTALADIQNRYDPDAGGDILSFGDLNRLLFGDASYFAWNTQDANANCFVLDLPTGGSVDVPVFAIVQAPSDMGYFNGVTQPSLAIEDADGDSWIRISYSADDTPAITVGGAAATISIPGITAYSWTDDIALEMGTGTDLSMSFTTNDANAHCLLVDLPTGAADSVPVMILADADADFGYFNGVVEPTFAVENLAGDSYLSMDFSGTTLARLIGGGSITGFSLTGPVAMTHTYGASAQTGTMSFAASTAAMTVNIATGTGVHTVHFADGAAANVVTIGSTSGAGSVTLQSGTGDLNFTSTDDFVWAATDDISLNGGSAGSIITIGGNAQGNVINVGTDNSAADTITVGSALDTVAVAGISVTAGSTGTTSALVLQSGTGDVAITSTDDGSFTVTDDLTLNGGSAGSIINLGTNTQGNVINIGSDDTTADTVTIGSAKDTSALAGISVTVGSTGTTSALVLQSGTGDVSVTSTDDLSIVATDDITIEGNSAGAILNLATDTNGAVVNIATDDSTADTINIGSAKDSFTFGGGDAIKNATGAGAVVGATCTAVEYAINGVHKTVLTIGTLGNIALEDKNDGNGVQVYDFPEGVISILGASCNLVVTSDAAITTSYVMSLGSTAGADNEETLTTTEANIIPSSTVTCGAGNEDFHGALLTLGGINGAATAVDLYVNAAVAAGDISAPANVTAASGTITIYWINAGDY